MMRDYLKVLKDGNGLQVMRVKRGTSLFDADRLLCLPRCTSCFNELQLYTQASGHFSNFLTLFADLEATRLPYIPATQDEIGIGKRRNKPWPIPEISGIF